MSGVDRAMRLATACRSTGHRKRPPSWRWPRSKGAEPPLAVTAVVEHDLAVTDPEAFGALVQAAQDALPAPVQASGQASARVAAEVVSS